MIFLKFKMAIYLQFEVTYVSVVIIPWQPGGLAAVAKGGAFWSEIRIVPLLTFTRLCEDTDVALGRARPPV